MSDVIQHNGRPYELVRVDDKTVVARPVVGLPASPPAPRPAPATAGADQPKRGPGRPRKSA